MAVVQISRIQIRRGQENVGTGLPQLASGELAWAIDTQQLYIGNGSVAEGAPAVGNTKVLTQNDLSAQGNLLALLQYVYKTSDTTIQTGASVNSPVSRSLQQRLDDFVTSVEFGTAGDGGSSDGLALQRAVDELFLNPNGKASADSISGTQKRIILNIPAGVYVTNKPLYIPSFANIVGSGADKTIIRYNPVYTITASTLNNSTVVNTTASTALMVGATVTGTNIPSNTTITSVVPGSNITLSNAATGTSTNISITVTLVQPAIQFVNDNSTQGNPSSIGSTLGVTQPRNIIMSGLTVETVTGTTTAMQLDAVRDSVFDNINLKGDWTVPDSISTSSIGILFQAVSSLVTCEHNLFKNVNVNGFTTSVFAKQDILNNVFEDCFFDDAQQGFLLGSGADGVSTGQLYGPRETQIVNCKFRNIKWIGVYTDLGTSNTVKDCKFTNVGAEGSGISGVAYPAIYFTQHGNTTANNYFDRSSKLSNSSNISVSYIPEVAGHGVFHSYGTLAPGSAITNVTDPAFLFRLPIPTDRFGGALGTITHVIDYSYTSSVTNFSRRGTLTIVLNVGHKKIQLSDEFDYAGSDIGNTNALTLDFSARFLNQSGGTWSVDQTPGSVAVYYSNTMNGDTGTFVYTYKSIF